MASATVKTAKEGKAKNATSAPRKPRAHPPYSEVICFCSSLIDCLVGCLFVCLPFDLFLICGFDCGRR